MDMEELSALRERIFEAYKQRTSRSRELYGRACDSLVGGVICSTRFYSPYPLYMTRGKGNRIYDVDGNEYIDCFLNGGPLLLGHCHPEVMKAVKRELERGLIVYNLDLAIECAELIKEIVPCAEKVRFANTGTEATMFAVRAARAFTDKKKIIKFYGHYHGLDDQFCVGTSNASSSMTSSGVPEESIRNTLLLRYDDIEVVKKKLDEDEDIAGIILDPQMTSGGIWPASHEYLKALRQITQERGVVLIFDEVMTGFRLAPGGAQEYFGVKPDLVALSKAIAAGGKLAAVAGREDVMRTLSPRGLVPTGATRKLALHGGTYLDGSVALAASIAALRTYKRLGDAGQYRKLSEQTEKLKTGIEEAFKQRELPVHVNRLGSMMRLFITPLEPSFEVYSSLDTTLVELFCTSLMTEGIFLTNPSLRAIFLSFVHTEEDIQRIIDAVHESLDRFNFKEAIYEAKR